MNVSELDTAELLQQHMGAAIREVRRDRGMTGPRLAAAMSAIGYNTWVAGTVSRVEAGTRKVSVHELVGLCLSLQVSVDQLVDEEAAAAFAGEAVGLTDDDAIDQAHRKVEERRLNNSLARKLGIPAADVDDLAHAVLGESALDHRDHLVGEALKARDIRNRAFHDPAPTSLTYDDLKSSGLSYDDLASSGLTFNDLATIDKGKLRGHATREIIRKLKEAIQ